MTTPSSSPFATRAERDRPGIPVPLRSPDVDANAILDRIAAILNDKHASFDGQIAAFNELRTRGHAGSFAATGVGNDGATARRAQNLLENSTIGRRVAALNRQWDEAMAVAAAEHASGSDAEVAAMQAAGARFVAGLAADEQTLLFGWPLRRRDDR